ncbi:MAG: hypothetical protein MI867_10235, partial [Pseudomonadales bacterium]|nr:hypothetical protein [Pseudomonadales bacterium]
MLELRDCREHHRYGAQADGRGMSVEAATALLRRVEAHMARVEATARRLNAVLHGTEEGSGVDHERAKGPAVSGAQNEACELHREELPSAHTSRAAVSEPNRARGPLDWDVLGSPPPGVARVFNGLGALALRADPHNDDIGQSLAVGGIAKRE